ncbi:MAG: hypothetical protein A3G75_11420 [Verrucomicrobia bacterium RIFCSPLOWO2_12_FULL_64_8]|nr:MAG: hypothetical protein A3G75_11420 [Verrucomicrobia bacterium RIFCSPLOWO2_12_FULL_64_8]
MPAAFASYAVWIPVLLTPVACLALAGPTLRSLPLRVRLVLSAWAAAFLVFYAFYLYTHQDWDATRFVLPSAPAVVVLALLVLRRLAARLGLTADRCAPAWGIRVIPVVGAAVLAAFLVLVGFQRNVLFMTHGNRVNADAARWAGEHFPANAVVFATHATPSLMYYTDLVFVRFDHEKVRRSPDFVERVARTGRPVHALLYRWEGRGDGRPDLPGEWDLLATIGDGEVFAWALRPAAKARSAEGQNPK